MYKDLTLKMNNKKAMIGLDTTKIVILSLLVIAVIVIAGMVILNSLNTSVETLDTGHSASVSNQSVSSVTELGSTLTSPTGRNVAFKSLSACINRTSSTLIPSGDYTNTGFTVYYVTNTTAPRYNNTDWNCTYTYSYDDTYALSVVQNYSSGNQSFFSQVPTFFVLLGVVVLILVIGIVVVSVSRFAGRDQGNITEV